MSIFNFMKSQLTTMLNKFLELVKVFYLISIVSGFISEKNIWNRSFTHFPLISRSTVMKLSLLFESCSCKCSSKRHLQEWW
ncbi:hypothetical protein AQUCO_00800107v1 [Aquilegia coerulea]|uniref:Uncharacterized protein n=1 Tax=Aquilegia coerulea TaxID=218851 RepID=A0A2G5EHE1_AQUCA|nr:hypothetical protein AQUCO_00800107v1 [Aquilegia coerulea]